MSSLHKLTFSLPLVAMPTLVVKGKIQGYSKSESYDNDGIKIISYRLTVNGKGYTVNLPGKTDIYFQDQWEVILLVNNNNEAVAGLCPKQNLEWGKTEALKKEVKASDGFELVQGIVLEKRRDSFTVNKGTSSSAYLSNSKTLVNYTIVLKEKNFRVMDLIGKEIKPQTEIAALLKNDIAYIIKDKTNNKIYGKPGKGFVLASVLLVAFNILMLYLFVSGKQSVVNSFNRVWVIGNLVFGLAFLFSFTGFLSESKTMKVFNKLLAESR